jgi:hypothetical protein
MGSNIELTEEEVNSVAGRLDDVIWDNFARSVESVINEREVGMILHGEISDKDIIRIKERLILIL